MSITLEVAEDAYAGNAEFSVAVDGKLINGVYTTTTLHGSGNWQTVTIPDVNLAAGSHLVTVTFLNDAYGGSSSKDRNLWVKSASAGGATVDEVKNLKSTGDSMTVKVDTPKFSSSATTADPATPVSPVVTVPILKPLDITTANSSVKTTGSSTPFSGVSIIDANAGQTETAKVSLSSSANGALSDPNSATDGSSIANGVLTVAGTAAEVAAALDGLVFTPSADQLAAGGAVTTTVTTVLTDTSGETASSISMVTAAHAPSAPNTQVDGTTGTIYDTFGNAWTITSDQKIAMNGVVIPSSSGVVTLVSTGSGLAQLNTSNDWWTQPLDGSAGTKLSSAPSGYVPSTPPLTPPVVPALTAISITSATSAVSTSGIAGAKPFSGVDITDTNVGQTETAQVSLSSPPNGAILDPNAASDGSKTVNGVVTITGTAAVVASALDGLLFEPKGTSETTTTTVTAAIADTSGQAAAASSTVIATPADLPPSGSSSVTYGTGSDSLVLGIKEDAYDGNAEFKVSVDGKQVGGTFTATTLNTASTPQVFTLDGNWGAGNHTVSVDFINDKYNAHVGDRNLYVESVSYDGIIDANGAASMMSSGTKTFSVSAPVATPPVTTPPVTTPPSGSSSVTYGTGSDSLVLGVKEDAYYGNAEFKVSVDGKQVGGTFTATTLNTASTPQVFTLDGNWGAGNHTVDVTFINDKSGGKLGDRNLYVDSVTYDGNADAKVPVELYKNGSTAFTVSSAASTIPPETVPPVTPPVTTPPVTASHGVSMLGVNLSGAESGNPVTGVIGYDYTYPTTSEIDYFASLGMNVIRLPVAWQRLQPVENGPLDQKQLSYIDNLVAYAKTKGVTIDIDLHNYGAGYGYDVGTAQTPDSAFSNFWGQMAGHFKGDSNVMFGLMNEPNSISASGWETAAQGAVSAIRSTGASQEILVSGSDWDTGSSWISSGNAATVGNITDPGNNMAFEVHQYFNTGSTGTSTQVVDPTIGPDSLASITNWAQENGKRLFLGEFGSGSDKASLTALGNTLNYINENSDVWQGGTYWAGGPWMSNYMFSADPSATGAESAQAATVAAAEHYA